MPRIKIGVTNLDIAVALASDLGNLGDVISNICNNLRIDRRDIDLAHAVIGRLGGRGRSFVLAIAEAIKQDEARHG
jgi:hypothetical protein